MKAVVRTILGDDPNTITDDTPATIRDDVTSAVCVEVSGLGHVLYSPEQDRAMFTQGPGTERQVDVAHAENGDTEVTVIKNGAGQRRMVVVLSD
jgi:hypothetical protein